MPIGQRETIMVQSNMAPKTQAPTNANQDNHARGDSTGGGGGDSPRRSNANNGLHDLGWIGFNGQQYNLVGYHDE